MMDAIRKYLISLCTAALLCALVRALVPGGRMKKLCSLLCGIFLMTAALSGISGWQLSDFAQELSKMQVAAEQARTGVEIRNREVRRSLSIILLPIICCASRQRVKWGIRSRRSWMLP